MTAAAKLLTVAFCSVLFISISAQTFTAVSPDGNVKIVLGNDVSGRITYSVMYKSKPIIKPSSLGFKLSKPEVMLNSFSVVSVDSSVTDETWKPVWGEVNAIRNNYRQIIVHLKDQSGSGILLDVVYRIFNDGIGFRYEFPKQPDLNYFIVADELTQFAIAGDNKTFWIPGDYDSNEYLYNTTKLSEVDALPAANKEKDIAVKALIGPTAVQTPLMMKSADGLYVNIHEAALLNYPAMDLILDKQSLTLTSTLVPDAVGNKAYMHAPGKTPWRTIVVSDKATDILASKLILNLNDPPKIGDDVSWIKPQKFIGVWWEMHIGKGTWDMASGKHAANTANVKKYIDFAAKYGFSGVLVEGWNVGWEDWFGNWKEEVFDFVTPYPDYNIDELTAYAKSKGVKIIMHHETSGAVTNYERWMDTAYRFMNNHNIDAVKTGYVGKIIPRGEHHDGQWMVNHYQRVAEKTAFYHIMLDTHEPVHPTGLQRTYPNWLACEAARGTEFNNAPAIGINPEHTTILPFTRLMGGPMDFTPGIFHMKLNQFVPERTTRVRTTLAKQLALYITMYSPLQMAADLPENYVKYLEAFQFIVDVPVDWDDTKILEAEPGDYITIARKQKEKDNWFLGAVTDENSRNMSVSLNFLDAGTQYEATIYKDAPNADWDTNPEAYIIEKKMVNNASKLNIVLAKGGGCAASIIKK